MITNKQAYLEDLSKFLNRSQDPVNKFFLYFELHNLFLHQMFWYKKILTYHQVHDKIQDLDFIVLENFHYFFLHYQFQFNNYTNYTSNFQEFFQVTFQDHKNLDLGYSHYDFFCLNLTINYIVIMNFFYQFLLNKLRPQYINNKLFYYKITYILNL